MKKVTVLLSIALIGTAGLLAQTHPSPVHPRAAAAARNRSIDVRKYDFAAQTPLTNLVSGSNTVTLAPCPLGVNGTDKGHYLYISDGVERTESVLLTGGTCRSGAARGTVVFTVANAHPRGWKVQSASAGIREASEVGGMGAQLLLTAGVYHAKAPISLSPCSALTGSGSSETIIFQDYANGDLIYDYDAPCSDYPYSLDVRAITFKAKAGVTIASGWMVHVTGGDGSIFDLAFEGCDNCLLLDAFVRGHVSHIRLIDWHGIGIQVGGPAGASGPTIDDVVGSTTVSDKAVGISCNSGILDLVNFDFQLTGTETKGLLFAPASPASCNPSQISNGIVDSAHYGIYADGTAGLVASIAVSNVYIDAGASSQAVYVDGVLGFTLSGSQLYGFGGSMVQVSSSKNVSITGTLLADAQALTDAITLSDVTGATIANNQIGVLSSNGGPDITNTAVGVYVMGASDYVVISGNYIGGLTPVLNTTSPAAAHFAASGNTGLSTPSVAAAATLAFPFLDDGQVFHIIGTASVDAVAGLRGPGQFGSFVTTDGSVTFASGSTIGNSCTTIRNKLYNWSWDGVQLWISGSGC